MRKFFNKLIVLIVFLSGGYHSIGHMWTVSGSANIEPAGTGVARIELRFVPPGTTSTPEAAPPAPPATQVVTPIKVAPVPDSVPPVVTQKPAPPTHEITLAKGPWKASVSTTLPPMSPDASRSEKWLERTLRTVGVKK